MAINKLTNNIQPNNKTDKINEIIDTINSGSVYSAGTGIDSTALSNGTIQVSTTIASKTDIGNGQIVLTQGGTSKGTINANQTSNATIDFEKTTVDSALDKTSHNPVENSVIATALEDISLAKNPNLNIIGSGLTVTSGNVSGFSGTNYLQFPFEFNFQDYIWSLKMSFTTGSDVTTQQNILDSYYGVALAISGGHFVLALSSNGTSWDIGNQTGSYTVEAETAYSVKIIWNGVNYTLGYSLDDTNYTTDITISSGSTIAEAQEYVGANPNIWGSGTAHAFGGTINLNKWELYVNNLLVWLGMDDVGLGSRANVSLSNLTPDGIDVIKANSKVQTINNISPDSNGNITLTASSVNALPDTTTIGAGNTTITVNGTIAGTINANATTDGNISITTGSGLPDQTGNSGKLLTTNGTIASWGTTSEIIPVVETYISGASWYRIYAYDTTGYRWCEQGGACTSGTAVTFLKTFVNTNFAVTPTYSAKSTTGFTPSATGNWIACGYIIDEVS